MRGRDGAHIGAANVVAAVVLVGLFGGWTPDDGRGAEQRRMVRPANHLRSPPPVRGARYFCTLPRDAARLPAHRRRGLARHLRQYPDLTLATTDQTAAARRLLAALRRTASRLRTLGSARAAGYDLRTARRTAGDRTPHYLHAESRRLSHDGRHLDPRRPESLIYANVPGKPLKLIGAMFSVPRGVRGPAVAGPIARWHFHRVCARGGKRGLTPRSDGSCPPGTMLGEGSEMLHVWFTPDLRSAYAIRAPQPELCAAGLLPRDFCQRGVGLAGM